MCLYFSLIEPLNFQESVRDRFLLKSNNTPGTGNDNVSAIILMIIYFLPRIKLELSYFNEIMDITDLEYDKPTM